MYLYNVTVKAGVKEYHFKNLEIYTLYIIKVLAFTRIGDGPWDKKEIYTEESGKKTKWRSFPVTHVCASLPQ